MKSKGNLGNLEKYESKKGEMTMTMKINEKKLVMVKTFLTVLVSLIILTLTTIALAQTPSWRNYSTQGEPNAYGTNITVKIPPDFEENKSPDKLITKEFIRKNVNSYRENSLTYLQVSFVKFNNVTKMYKTAEGDFKKNLVETMMSNAAISLEGMKHYNLLWYENYPAYDAYIEQSQNKPYVVYKEISMRTVLYDNIMVKLECGDFSQNKEFVQHEKNIDSICKPFFDSLELL
jgi:hypothetical protein